MRAKKKYTPRPEFAQRNGETQMQTARRLAGEYGVHVETARNWVQGRCNPLGVSSSINQAKVDDALRDMVEEMKPAETFTLQEIGTRCGITREAVRQIEERALRKLRKLHPSLRGEIGTFATG